MSGAAKMENIIVHNASENNLKNVTVHFPLDHFTCVTGPSGCGKSSLVFDTVYAESQRNFLESISGNLFGQKLMDKPKVDSIDNLRPALNISQNYYNVNPRSTVGTITDISYYLRTLYAFIANQETGSHWDMNSFSPNNPAACCPRCNGLGEEYIISEQAVMPDKNKSLASGGILYYKGTKTSQEYKLLEAICDAYSIDINKKICELTESERYQLLYRVEPNTFHIKFKTPKGRYKQWSVSEKGALIELQEKLGSIDQPSVFSNISKFLVKATCSVCNGEKINNKLQNVRICELSIGKVEMLPVLELIEWCKRVEETYKNSDYFDQIKLILSDIVRRLDHLCELNLDYISIGRSIPTLSGGELQRVRMATQMDCSLSGLVYILDEPCKGLHYKNVDSIITATRRLVGRGNTVIAIEHNKQYIAAAEHLIRMGPTGGPQGGYVIEETSGQNSFSYDIHFKLPRNAKKFIDIRDITYRNLKHINVQIPLNSITCISGVSGSGKSSLSDIIEECCSKGESPFCSKVSGHQMLKKVMRVNQQPIGKTARSTVISYLGIYEAIRELFSETPESKKGSLTASSFSMNVAGGRCECCQGTGKQKIELSYLPETYIVCPECKGKRFHEDVLAIKYKGYTINDILDSSVNSLLPVFEEEKSVYTMLQCLDDIGLGYISLGQMSMSLSGGEAQRIKLAKYLGLSSKGNALYILDEPTSGLNQEDIELLCTTINRLADQNETIVIVEHNAEFIARIADYLVDLGSVAGIAGGNIVIQGTPENVMKDEESSWFDMSFS